ncbi:MAG: UDP-N-acetylenolpyruvoylglucosamine reductase [Chloroflexota bacterium]|nr:MAG: UDP-N-acetylenolpyruvoylglucosamine reductase [Chloroflexota bacterium]
MSAVEDHDAAAARASAGSPATPPGFDPAAVAAEIGRRIGVKVVRNQPLARLTTLRVGGPADLYVVARNAFELRALVRFARSRDIPHVLLGRGSNVVVADAGIRGLVIAVRAEGSRIEGERYLAEAGVPMARAATETSAAGLAGLEFGLAIPGTVGGAVWANAGAHGADVAAVLESATVLTADGREVQLGPSELGLAYRTSRLKVPSGPSDVTPPGRAAAPTEVVLAAAFRLRPDDPAAIRARLDEIRRWRREHQPLGLPSAGSVFRNPPGDAAGRLVEAAGCKGWQVGGARVSERHANFIVTDGRARAADVRRLAERVRAAVEERFGIRLEYEVVFLGDWPADDEPDGPDEGLMDPPPSPLPKRPSEVDR